MSEIILVSLNTFTNYIGVRGILAMGTIFTLCYMVLKQQAVPSDFYIIIGLVLGYYFGKQDTKDKGNNGKDC